MADFSKQLADEPPDQSAGGAILPDLPGESDVASSFQHNGNEAALTTVDSRDKDKQRGERKGCMRRSAVPQMRIETRSWHGITPSN